MPTSGAPVRLSVPLTPAWIRKPTDFFLLLKPVTVAPAGMIAAAPKSHISWTCLPLTSPKTPRAKAVSTGAVAITVGSVQVTLSGGVPSATHCTSTA